MLLLIKILLLQATVSSMRLHLLSVTVLICLITFLYEDGDLFLTVEEPVDEPQYYPQLLALVMTVTVNTPIN